MESLSPSTLLGVKQPELNTDRIWDFEASLVSSREAAPALLFLLCQQAANWHWGIK